MLIQLVERGATLKKHTGKNRTNEANEHKLRRLDKRASASPRRN
jgi:hypothetical protein